MRMKHVSSSLAVMLQHLVRRQAPAKPLKRTVEPQCAVQVRLGLE